MSECKTCAAVRAADLNAFGTDAFVRCKDCGRFPRGQRSFLDMFDDAPAAPPPPSPFPAVFPNPFGEQYTAFAEQQRREIIEAISGKWLRQLESGVPAWNSVATTTTAVPTYAEILTAYHEAQRILGKGRFPDLTPEGKPITLPVSQAAARPPGTIGDEPVSNFPAFTNAHPAGPQLTPAEQAAALVAQRQKREAELAAERLVAVKALASTFMGEARQTAADAFRIAPGRQVDYVGMIGLTRVPLGRYVVVTHAVHGGDGAVLSLKAARPWTPGGKLDRTIFPRVPVNGVNPVPFWNVFPRERYGALCDVLPGTAEAGFCPDAWRMLADQIDTDFRNIEWQGGGWAVMEEAIEYVDGQQVVVNGRQRFANEFANAIRLLCDEEDARRKKVAGGNVVSVSPADHPMPFGEITITPAVNNLNHHPAKKPPTTPR